MGGVQCEGTVRARKRRGRTATPFASPIGASRAFRGVSTRGHTGFVSGLEAAVGKQRLEGQAGHAIAGLTSDVVAWPCPPFSRRRSTRDTRALTFSTPASAPPPPSPPETSPSTSLQTLGGTLEWRRVRSYGRWTRAVQDTTQPVQTCLFPEEGADFFLRGVGRTSSGRVTPWAVGNRHRHRALSGVRRNVRPQLCLRQGRIGPTEPGDAFGQRSFGWGWRASRVE